VTHETGDVRSLPAGGSGLPGAFSAGLWRHPRQVIERLRDTAREIVGRLFADNGPMPASADRDWEQALSVMSDPGAINALANELSRLTAQPSEVERLTRERDEARRMTEERSTAYAMFPAVTHERDTLRAEVERLKAELAHERTKLASPPAPSGWQPSSSAPEDGLPFLAYGPELVDEDFTPDGIVEACFDGEAFVGAIWNNCSDEWMTQAVTFTHWMRVQPPGPHAKDAFPPAPSRVEKCACGHMFHGDGKCSSCDCGWTKPMDALPPACPKCELVKEAAHDATLSDLSARIAIQTIVDPAPITQEDVEFAGEVLKDVRPPGPEGATSKVTYQEFWLDKTGAVMPNSPALRDKRESKESQ
jgi:hypothetical protein